MPGFETSMGGDRESFPETAWSNAIGELESGSPRRAEAVGRLLSGYWRPVYRYIRTSEGRSIEDAKDLTQEFFRHLLEENVIAKYRPERGRLRHYLKGTLRNFLAELRRADRSLKRGGGRTIVPLDVGELEQAGPAGGDAPPDEAFDRQWKADVLARSLGRLREQLASQGKADCMRAYELYELASGERRPTYEEVGRALNVPAHQVKNHLDLARRELQRIVVEIVAESVLTRDELREEIQDLFAW